MKNLGKSKKKFFERSNEDEQWGKLTKRRTNDNQNSSARDRWRDRNYEKNKDDFYANKRKNNDFEFCKDRRRDQSYFRK